MLPHLPPATLQLLVDYVYRGEAAVSRLELATFLAAARELQLEVAGLHQVCTVQPNGFSQICYSAVDCSLYLNQRFSNQ